MKTNLFLCFIPEQDSVCYIYYLRFNILRLASVFVDSMLCSTKGEKGLLSMKRSLAGASF